MSSAESPILEKIDPVAGYRDNDLSVLAMRADFLAGPVTPEHSHTRVQLAMLPNHVLRLRTNNRLWVAAPGQALWIPARLRHQTWSDSRPTMRSLFVQPDEMRNFSAKPLLIEVQPLLREVVTWLAEADANEAGSAMWSRLAQTAIDLIKPLKSAALPLPNPNHPKLRRIEACIRANPTNQHPIGYYAALESMAGRSLLRLVLSHTGLNWRQWRRLIVLSEAMPKLAAGIPVGVVAADLGFRSSGSFVTAFREVFGRTPGRFLA